MSYCSESVLSRDARLDDIKEFIELLGYRRLQSEFKTPGSLGQYLWFEDEDCKSYAGVGLDLSRNDDGAIVVGTRTPIARSYCDLSHQNQTIRTLRKFFGRTFTTDAGRGRYLHAEGDPPSPAEAGCNIAFQRFGGGLIRATFLLESRQFQGKQWKQRTGFHSLDSMNPRLLSNNLMLPYLVAILEDYFKSTFVAILRYSGRKESVLKSARLSSGHLAAVSSARISVEEALAETLPFQRITSICQHFKALDPKLDFEGTLRKPFRRRKETLFESLEAMTEHQHALVHNAAINTTFDDDDAHRTLDDLEHAVVRCHRRLVSYYGWEFEQGWPRGNRRRRARLAA